MALTDQLMYGEDNKEQVGTNAKHKVFQKMHLTREIK
jgi:hypothetical protein